jgi:predicted deacylase
MTAARAPFEIGGFEIGPGERKLVNLPLSALSNRTPMALPVCVMNGRRDGPVLFVSAAIHGDELTGVGVCRRLLSLQTLEIRRGTLLVVPIVNAFGFIGHTRYLPDGRDLNRSFPGSAKGSLASRLANLFLREVVMRCDFGIDLHSAALHRENLPQIRADCGDVKAFELAQAFGAPVIVHSALRDGSLRQVGRERGVPIIVYEAGEGLRFDMFSVRMGETGVLRVLAHLGMIRKGGRHIAPSVVATGSSWVRAPESGLFRPDLKVGDHVTTGQKIGIIGDAYGASEVSVRATIDGLVIGRSNMPSVNEGDPLFNIARVEEARQLVEHIDELERLLTTEALPDEDEIV